MSPQVRERLEQLREATGAESLTEVIRRSLAIYETLVAVTAAGPSIVIRDSSGKERDLVLVP